MSSIFVVAPSALPPRRRALAARVARFLTSRGRKVDLFTIAADTCGATADAIAHPHVRVRTPPRGERVAQEVLRQVNIWALCAEREDTVPTLNIIVFDDEDCADRLVHGLVVYSEYVHLTVVLARGRIPMHFHNFRNVRLLVPTLRAHLALVVRCLLRFDVHALKRARRYPFFMTTSGKGSRNVAQLLRECA